MSGIIIQPLRAVRWAGCGTNTDPRKAMAFVESLDESLFVSLVEAHLYTSVPISTSLLPVWSHFRRYFGTLGTLLEHFGGIFSVKKRTGAPKVPPDATK